MIQMAELNEQIQSETFVTNIQKSSFSNIIICCIFG